MCKKAVVTVTVGNTYEEISKLTHTTIKNYSDKIGAEFVVIDHILSDPRWSKFELKNLLDIYDRIIFVDTDLIIRDDCPDLFDIVPENKIGLFEEGRFSPRGGYLMSALQAYDMKIDEVKNEYYNTGVMVLSRQHKYLFDRDISDKIEISNEFLGEQTYLNLLFQLEGIEIYLLSYKFNRMTLMDNYTGESRLASYIVHYAGCPSSSMMLGIIKEDLDSWKKDGPLYNDYKKRIVIRVGGGLGDQVCVEPVARYIINEIYKDEIISIISDWPRIFKHLGVPVMRQSEWPGSSVPIRIIETMPASPHPIWNVIPHTLCHSVDFSSMAAINKIIPDGMKNINLDISAKGISEVSDYIGLPYEGENLVAIHPGRGWPSKTFPKDWWNGVIHGICSKSKSVIIGKHISDEQGYVDVECPEGCVDLRDKLSIDGLIEVIRRAAVLVSNDSAPIHIAGAFDNWIVLIPTCKHPDNVLPYRGELGKKYKTISIYNKLTVDYIDSSPTRLERQTLDYVNGDIMDYLPESSKVVDSVQQILNKL